MMVASVMAAGALLAGAPALVSASWPATSSDLLACTSDVFDPSGLLDSSVATAITRTEQSLDADVRVRAERSVDGGLDARIDQLVAQCDGWAAADGELADDMVVVLFSELEREASVYYGADLGPDLEYRWSDAVDAMTAEFPADYSDGVVAALRVLRTEPSGAAAESPPTSATSSSAAGPVIALVVIGILIVAGLVSYVRREGWSGGTWSGGSYADDGHDSGGGLSWSSSSSRRRRRSSFGISSSRSRARSSGSRRSSSRGSRRAGGGTKKW